MDKVNNIYLELKSKYKKSITIFLLLNIIVFSLTAISILLNIFTIRKNEAGDTTKWLFVTIAILSAVSGLISSIMSIYTFRKRNRNTKEIINSIEIEKRHFKDKSGDYSSPSPETIFVDNVEKLLNKNG